MAEHIERALIEGTVRDIRDAITALQRQRDELDHAIRQKQERLAEWEARLARGAASSPGGRKKRNPKGENLRRLIELLKSEPTGVPMTTVTKRTGIPASSVRAIVKRYGDLVEEQRGLLTLKASSVQH